MIYKVFHNDAAKFRDLTDAEKANFPNGFTHVADVIADDMSNLYFLTNHVDSNWLHNPQVHAYVKAARSTSVGDVYEHEDGTRYAICGIGMEKF